MGAYLSFDELGLDGGPCLALGGVAEQVHDNGSTGDSLVHLEEICAGDPAILLRLFPGCSVLSHTDDDVQAVVAEIETLSMALGAVADQGEGVVLEVFL